jgi:hypothetical protein
MANSDDEPPGSYLDPADRVKRGFQRLRVEDRTAPGYPGAFLYSGSPFGDFRRQGTDTGFLRTPLEGTYDMPDNPFDPRSESNPMAVALGIKDIKSQMEEYNKRLAVRREAEAKRRK